MLFCHKLWALPYFGGSLALDWDGVAMLGLINYSGFWGEGKLESGKLFKSPCISMSRFQFWDPFIKALLGLGPSH